MRPRILNLISSGLTMGSALWLATACSSNDLKTISEGSPSVTPIPREPVFDATLNGGSFDGGEPNLDPGLTGSTAGTDASTIIYADAGADAAVSNDGGILCSLLMQTGCAPGEGCYPIQGVGRCATAGSATAGGCTPQDSPFQISTCDRTYACVAAPDLGTSCMKICDTSADPQSTCGASFKCRSLGVSPSNAGYCTP